VVVAGAGSAGGVVAARLSEDPGVRVLLLEAGPDFPDELTSPPAFFAGGNTLGENFAGVGAPTPELDWNYWSDPMASGRKVHLRRGKLVGGSSMINGCVALRGAPSDFAQWVALGASSWGWSEVVPYYECAEAEVNIQTYRRDRWQPIQKAFHSACTELGFRQVESMNSPDAWEGIVGSWPHNYRNGVRQGTLVTYLRQARPRQNFDIVAHATVDRVLINRGRAVGVAYVDGDGRSHSVNATGVVLSCGVYGSPSVLLRSGIGPEDDLRKLGVKPIADLSVGEGLRDHPQCLFEFEVQREAAEMSGPIGATAARGQGWFGFPLAVNEDAGICAIAIALVGQEPIGKLELRGLDPRQPPEISHGLQLAIDRSMFAGAWQSFNDLVTMPALREVGARGGDTVRTLDEVLEERLGTAFHPTSTCAIGKVVDDSLGVLGVSGLWVADASIFPANVSTNTNLTCLMVGERAAGFISAGLDRR